MNRDQPLMKRSLTIAILNLALVVAAIGQTYIVDVKRESARSDKLTGGRIERTILEPGNPNIKITINVPAFQMTLWQDGKEVKSYPIGVGMIDFPIVIGLKQASSIEWNPVWIPPSSDWIEKSSTVKPGEIILPTDPRNPLGKVKIPLGYGYLLHQAKGPGDMGSLVSHGCVRVMQSDLYDLSEKIVAARGLEVSAAQIAAAKRNKRTLVARLDPIVPVEITYDTIVVEGGRLNIYPDVYDRKLNTVENVRRELRTSRVGDEQLSEAEITKMIARASGRQKFLVDVSAIEEDLSLTKGRAVSVVATRGK
jgi:lipoprotein-anchoring transpeptidase ErfK/SrfK